MSLQVLYAEKPNKTPCLNNEGGFLEVLGEETAEVSSTAACIDHYAHGGSDVNEEKRVLHVNR